MPRWLSLSLKWTVWPGLTGWLFCSAQYLAWWRVGLINYGCMQTLSPSAIAFMSFYSQPSTGIAVDIAMIISCFSVVIMMVDLKYGPKAGKLIRERFVWFALKPYFSLPVFLGLIWYIVFDHSFYHVSGISWFLLLWLLISLESWPEQSKVQ